MIYCWPLLSDFKKVSVFFMCTLQFRLLYFDYNVNYCNIQAGEALGAIGSSEVLDVLKEYAKDPQTEVQSKTVVIEEHSGKMALMTNFIKIKIKVPQTFKKFMCRLCLHI